MVRRADSIAILTLLELPLFAFLVLVLRYRSTLVNLDELPEQQQLANPPLQFHLAWFFALTTLLALAMTLAYSLKDRQGNWGNGMMLLAQVCVWLLTADQLLQPRVRWWLVLVSTLAMFGAWVAFLQYQRADLAYLRNDWGRMQMMLMLTVLSYRWAGWRMVNTIDANSLRELGDKGADETLPGTQVSG
jgi:hypothetical protein